MVTLNSQGPSAYDSDPDELLKQNDSYIVSLARKKVPRNVIRREMLDDEIDELAQKIRIKLWLKSRKEKITSPKAYISQVAHTETVDIVRQHKSDRPLLMDQDGELCYGSPVAMSEGIEDPAEKLEEEEQLKGLIARVIEGVLALPRCQRLALICSLKERMMEMDIFPLVDALRDHGVDIEAINWPEEKDEVQRLRASLTVARKKLRSERTNIIGN